MSESFDDREKASPLSPEQMREWHTITSKAQIDETDAIERALEAVDSAPQFNLTALEEPYTWFNRVETVSGDFVFKLLPWTVEKHPYEGVPPLAKLLPSAGTRELPFEIPQSGKYVVLEGPSIAQYVSKQGPTHIAQGFNLAFKEVRTEPLNYFDPLQAGKPLSVKNAIRKREEDEHLRSIGLIREVDDGRGNKAEVKLIIDDDNIRWTPEISQLKVNLNLTNYGGIPVFPETE